MSTTLLMLLTCLVSLPVYAAFIAELLVYRRLHGGSIGPAEAFAWAVTVICAVGFLVFSLILVFRLVADG